jgi:hypothetical protein
MRRGGLSMAPPALRAAARLGWGAATAGTSMLSVLYAARTCQVWDRRGEMTQSEVAEWSDICRTPGMDCEPDPMAWAGLALVFGMAALLAGAAGLGLIRRPRPQRT